MSEIMIHPTACVDPKALLGKNVTVGPYCCVGPEVVLGDDCMLNNHVTIEGRTTCGVGNVFFAGSVIGSKPQDMKYGDTPTRAIIGDHNTFREQVTVHVGTELGGGVTRIGSHNLFMVGSHIAHDADIGNHCILANCVHLAGHVRIEDRANIGGVVGIHHFTTIGRLAYVGGMSRITQDVAPFMVVEGHKNTVRGYNKVGLQRADYKEERIQAIRQAFTKLFGKRTQREQEADPGDDAECSTLTFGECLAELEAQENLTDDVRYLCEFLRRKEKSDKGRYLDILRTDRDRAKLIQTARRQETEV